jgi:adenine-specific DNA-methyltransferase
VRRVIKGVPGAKDEKLKKGLGGSFSYFELGDPIEMESILEGKNLPSYIDLARYVFYTATGEEFLPEKVNEARNFIGESRDFEVYLFYKPNLDYLKSTALTLDLAKSLGESKGKKKLVFAPAKYLDLNDTEMLTKHGLKDIEYCQLPFEIYKLRD